MGLHCGPLSVCFGDGLRMGLDCGLVIVCLRMGLDCGRLTACRLASSASW